MKHVKLHNCVCNDIMHAQDDKFRDECHLNFCRFCIDLGRGLRTVEWGGKVMM